MKRLLIALLLLAAPAWAGEPFNLARMNPAVLGAGVSSASCSVSNHTKLDYPVSQPGTSVSGANYAAFKVVLSSNSTITAYKILTCYTTGSSYFLSALYDDDGNGASSKPTTPVSNSTKTLPYSDLPACATTNVVEYALDTPLAISSGTYWIVNELSTGVDGRRNVYYNTSDGDRVCYSTDGTSWTCVDNTAYDMELWGCQ